MPPLRPRTSFPQVAKIRVMVLTGIEVTLLPGFQAASPASLCAWMRCCARHELTVRLTRRSWTTSIRLIALLALFSVPVLTPAQAQRVTLDAGNGRAMRDRLSSRGSVKLPIFAGTKLRFTHVALGEGSSRSRMPWHCRRAGAPNSCKKA